MPNRTAAIVSAALIGAMLAAAAVTLAVIPAATRLPIHYGFDGRANRWAPASIALFLLPAVSALLWVLFAVLPRIDPRGANLRRSAAAYGTIWIAATAVLGLTQLFTIVHAFGVAWPASSFFTVVMGGSLIVIGNVMGKLRWNYTVGIRTPWTLSNERVWDKTHRFGGWALVIGGIVLVVGGLALPSGMSNAPVTLGVLAAVVLATLVRSYLFWQEETRQTH
jgi:uncharacterized membrane protein